MAPKKTFDAAALNDGDRYKLLSGLIVPRPIGWVGTVDATGRYNLAPFSFFNMVSGTPPTVLFSPGITVRTKDTLRNVMETGEFSLNVVTAETVGAMNITSAEYPPEVDEFAAASLTPVAADVIAAPLVVEAKANMECRVVRLVDIGELPSATVVFGEVLRFHVAVDILDGTRIDHAALGAIGRMGGDTYTTTADSLIVLKRPTRPG